MATLRTQAAPSPAFPSFTIIRSYSANAPSICIIIRPAGTVVSMASVQRAQTRAGSGDPF